MDHCREALLGGIGNSQRELRLARLVQRLGDLLLQALGALGVEIDRRDGEPAAAGVEGAAGGAAGPAAPDRGPARPRLAKLDARLLQRDEVLERVRDRPE